MSDSAAISVGALWVKGAEKSGRSSARLCFMTETVFRFVRVLEYWMSPQSTVHSNINDVGRLLPNRPGCSSAKAADPKGEPSGSTWPD